MKTLIIDIETAPNLVYVWQLWRQNVGINQIVETGRILSFAAKWHGKKQVMFHSEHHDGYQPMLDAAHELLDEADIIIHYNGRSFDMPWLRREFLMAEMDPPSPWQDIDLRLAMRNRFRFASNKLDHIVQELGLGAKIEHEGFELWLGCMAGDESAWRKMKRYNIHDVRLTEKLYDRVLPWIPQHPNVALDDGRKSCTRCGAESRFQVRRGFIYTSAGKFVQYRCSECGSYSRGHKRVDTTNQRALTP